MIEAESQLRRWGRSLGLVIPKEIIVRDHLKEGDIVELVILKKSDAIKNSFGTVALKRPTVQILREIDKEGWDEQRNLLL